MRGQDFGPVAVSRLKEELPQVLEALEQHRRVLVSRHGSVVAAIEPASTVAHGAQLASFALGSSEVRELSATQISQGSPAEAVSRAATGEPVLLTKRNKVYGVLGAPIAEDTLESAIRQEAELVAFETTHPDATPEEFAAMSAAVVDPRPAPSGETAGADEVIVDAMLVKGQIQEVAKDLTGAEATFRSTIEKYRGHPDLRVRSKVAQTMVELAKVYSEEGRTEQALGLTDGAVELLTQGVPEREATA